ncbi:MAG: metallophosphoesterase [Gemmatimonadota bacterium]
MTTLVHLSDLHFGRDVDLEQVAEAETFVATSVPNAVVISGDLTQRARHGEFQRALVFVDRMRSFAPTLVIPGNHDVQWWETPFDVTGADRKHRKYRQYFGDDLTPTLELPGLCVASVLTSHGVVWGSMTWRFWRDAAVKGHLPSGEVERIQAIFDRQPAGTTKVLALHQNVVRGEISNRMGLARGKVAARRLAGSGADLILCGHDHQESMSQLDDRVVVATAGTLTRRTRGKRASAFNLITLEADSIAVQHQMWEVSARTFTPGVARVFPRSG